MKLSAKKAAEKMIAAGCVQVKVGRGPDDKRNRFATGRIIRDNQSLVSMKHVYFDTRSGWGYGSLGRPDKYCDFDSAIEFVRVSPTHNDYYVNEEG